MKRCGISGNFLSMIKDLYKRTKCSVKVGNSVTDFFKFTKGVRQGCPMSPLLFNLFVNDIFEVVNACDGSDISLEGSKINALMYADDLILLSESEKGLQKQIDKVGEYCEKWKLEINVKKTKVMIFNRGNKLLKRHLYFNGKAIENVKTFKYLGFTISAKNCSFAPTIDNLALKANRAVFALNNKIKISKLPVRVALKIFNSQIMPILLYGSEVWGPYMDFDYASWDKSKIEQVHTQFLKRAVGCNFQTSNIMARGEVGRRPLLLDIFKRVVAYTKNIKNRTSSTVFSAYDFEVNNALNNDPNPNFATYVDKFDLNCENIFDVSKSSLTKLCQESYDRLWWIQISNSPKAISYITFKSRVKFESYFHQVDKLNHRKSLTRFRMSNHSLMIEKGRHLRPKLERGERKCFICKTDVEDEFHFVTKCSLYTGERKCLFNTFSNKCNNFESMTEKQRFIYIFSNEDIDLARALSKFLFRSFKLRDLIYLYFFK